MGGSPFIPARRRRRGTGAAAERRTVQGREPGPHSHEVALVQWSRCCFACSPSPRRPGVRPSGRWWGPLPQTRWSRSLSRRHCGLDRPRCPRQLLLATVSMASGEPARSGLAILESAAPEHPWRRCWLSRIKIL